MFESYSPDVRSALLVLRELILEMAAATDGVGALDETLKWGQPSYLTAETGSGSTIRIAPAGAKSVHDYAIFFICSTDLVSRFQALFGDAFVYEKNRAVLFDVGAPIPVDELRECIEMALTYHLVKAT